VDQSSPNLFRPTREETLSLKYFSDFGYLYPFRRYSRSKWEGVRNQAKISVFCAPQFFFWGGGQPPKFLNRHL